MRQTHECPAVGCTVHVPRHQLACRPHWYSIPREIRSRIWSGYRSNNAETHSQALADALSFFHATATTTLVNSGSTPDDATAAVQAGMSLQDAVDMRMRKGH